MSGGKNAIRNRIVKKVYETTDLDGLHPVFWDAIRKLNLLWLARVGHELHILHGLDGKHSRFSRHYQGCAIDIRTWHNPTDQSSGQIKFAEREELKREIRQILGKNFWLLDHFASNGDPTHFHIAFKPEDSAWTT